MKNLLLISSLFIFLGGCSLMPKPVSPVEVRTIQEVPPMYHPPLPMELQLVDIDWEVINPELMREYLAELDAGNAPPQAYYSLTGKDYENLSMNMAEFKRYLRDILSVVEYYREFGKEEDDEDEK